MKTIQTQMISLVCVLIVSGLSRSEAQQGATGGDAFCWGPLLENKYLYLYPDGYSYRTTMSLSQAQAECLTLPTCGGVTTNPNSGFWECRRGSTPMASSSGEKSYVRQGCAGGTCADGETRNDCNTKCTCSQGNWGCISTCALAPPPGPGCVSLLPANPSYPNCCAKQYCSKPECWGPQLANRYLYQYPTAGYTPRKLSLGQAQAECLTLVPNCGGVTQPTQGTNAGYWESRKGTTPYSSPYGEVSYVLQNVPGCSLSAFLEAEVSFSNDETTFSIDAALQP